MTREAGHSRADHRHHPAHRQEAGGREPSGFAAVLAVLLTEAARTGTKIVGIGDHLQLQAVGPGGWFHEVHRLVHGLTLTENRRQEDAAERAALDVWRTGDHELALRILADGGRLHPAETAQEARSQILMAWNELRLQHWADPHDLIANMVVLAARNADVDALNLGAQAIRREARGRRTRRRAHLRPVRRRHPHSRRGRHCPGPGQRLPKPLRQGPGPAQRLPGRHHRDRRPAPGRDHLAGQGRQGPRRPPHRVRPGDTAEGHR
ncbi:hypothetical protein C0036_27180 [Streptomyces sp. DJ]|nr:hypothetical protein C0036_27180 [Streptomyces sp. DJ]